MSPKIYTAIFLALSATPVCAQTILNVKNTNGTATELLILPPYYKTDTSCKEMKVITTRKKPAPFATQLNKLAIQAIASGANTLKVTALKDGKQNGNYSMRATMLYAKNYDQLKEHSLSAKQALYKDNTNSRIIIYRPEYCHGGRNEELEFEVMVNDTLKLTLKPNTKYQLKLNHEGKVKLTVDYKGNSNTTIIDAAKYHSYYVRGYVNFPGAHKQQKVGESLLQLSGYTPYLELPDETEGEIESNLVTQITVIKRI